MMSDLPTGSQDTKSTSQKERKKLDETMNTLYLRVVFTLKYTFMVLLWPIS